MNIDHANASDYDELLDCLNDSFAKTPANSFDKALPVMWRHTDEAMKKHLIIRDGAKIAAVVGVYPLHVVVGGQEILVTTIGNVGTRAPYRGKDYMKTLMTAAVQEAKAMGATAARLGGQRQRYNRYGFDIAARNYAFSITRKNIRAYYDGSFTQGESYAPQYTFKKIERTDHDAIAAARAFQEASFMYVKRGDDDSFYDVMTAWQNVPYLALGADGAPVGYVSASPKLDGLAEHFGATPDIHYQLILDWLTTHESLDFVGFQTTDFHAELNHRLMRLADNWTAISPTRIAVFDFPRLAQVLLAAREKAIAPAPKGRFVLGIQGDATLEFTDGTVQATTLPPMLTLDRLAATRLLFGHCPANAVADIPQSARNYVSALFPLPLGWNNQDRV